MSCVGVRVDPQVVRRGIGDRRINLRLGGLLIRRPRTRSVRIRGRVSAGGKDFPHIAPGVDRVACGGVGERADEALRDGAVGRRGHIHVVR